MHTLLWIVAVAVGLYLYFKFVCLLGRLFHDDEDL